MSPRRSAAPAGLSTSEIDSIRESLAAGRKPKVMFTAAAGQIAGEVGQVVKLNDPSESDEWVVVRFGRDELPFAPTDLTIPPRGRAAKKAAPEPAPKPAPAPPAATSPGSTAPPATAPAAAPAVPTPRAAAAAPARSNPPSSEPAVSGQGPRPVKRAARKARANKPKAPAALTVTLAYEGGEWTVAAHQGSKTLAKPYEVRPADALKMVAMIDVPGVHDAVEAIVSAELAEAAERAEQLRNELAEVEARLADLRDAS